MSASARRTGRLGLLIGVAVLAFSGPSARASTGYRPTGSFDASGILATGLAVDQSSGVVYDGLYDNSELGLGHVGRFDSSGVSLGPFGSAHYAGVAVDQATRHVYALDGVNGEVGEFDSTGASVGARFGSGTLSQGIYTQIWADSSGDVFVPDSAANAVDEFGASRALMRQLTGSGATRLSAPQGVAVDSTGNVYIVDAGNNRVEEFTSAGAFVAVLGTRTLSSPQALTVDLATNDVYVADNARGGPDVVEFDSTGSIVRAFGAGSIPSGELSGLAVNSSTGAVYVLERGFPQGPVMIFGSSPVNVPTATTGSATGVSPTEEAVTGTVDPQGTDTRYHFEYGTSTAYASTAPPADADVGSGNSGQAAAALLTELQPNKAYHYRLVATNAEGDRVYGADQTFTTQAAPPSLTTTGPQDTPTAVTQTGATLNDEVNPENSDTHYYFRYGTDSSYAGGEAPLPAPGADAGSGFGAQLVSATVAGLAPNTVYHYQLVAVNSAGPPVAGPDQTFITSPPAPTATTGAAEKVGSSSAALTGAVDPGSFGPNSDTTWYFRYGTDETYGLGVTPSPAGDAGTGTSPVAVASALTGLAPNTTYHYRVAAVNDGANPMSPSQSSEGQDQRFTTLPADVFLDQISGLTPGSVTLNGEVNPSGHPLEYRFEYGPSVAYGQSTPLTPAGEASGYTPVSAAVAHMPPGDYHYRLTALGGGGATYSVDSTFSVYSPGVLAGSNPFGAGSSASPPPSFPLLARPMFPSQPATVTPTPVTRAGRLHRALRACRRHRASRKRRASCEAAARQRYGKAGRAR
jgi:hypothetical protein